MLDLREIREIDELRLVEDVQREVWGMRDLDIVPALVLKASISAGGSLLGAFEGDELAGFVYAFVGIDDDETVLHSDMLAVRPPHRGAGLGRKLKLAQREAAISRGIGRITWTFDPLQSENAHLNFARLGVTSRRYIDDFYGETGSILHAGTATDRLWVSWDLESDRVRNRITGNAVIQKSSLFLLLEMNADGAPKLKITDVSQQLAIEIPTGFRDIVVRDRSAAEEWRSASREAFHYALERGYTVTDFVRGESSGTYLLTQVAQ